MTQKEQFQKKIFSNYTANESDSTLYVDTTNGVINIYIDTPIRNDNLKIIDLGKAATNKIIVRCNELINGSNRFEITENGAVYDLKYNASAGTYTASSSTSASYEVATFSNTVKIDNYRVFDSKYTMSGDLTFVLDSSNALIGASEVRRVIGDGNNIIFFGEEFTKQEQATVSGEEYQIVTFYDGLGVVVNVLQGTPVVPSIYSPTATAVIDRMTSLTTTEKDAIASFVDSQASAEGGSGNWELLDNIYLPVFDNETSNLTGWKNNALVKNGTVTVQKGGYVFANAGQLDSAVVSLSNYTQNDALAGFFSVVGTSDLIEGVFGIDNGALLSLHSGIDTIRITAAFNAGSGSITGQPVDDIIDDTIYHLVRDNSSTYDFYAGGSNLQTISKTTTGVPSGVLTIGNYQTTGGNQYNGTIGGFWVGAGTGFNVASFDSALRTLLTALSI